MPRHPADRIADFGKAIFTEFLELAAEYDALDLSTGYPDYDGPEEAMEAAARALRDGRNQYAPVHGEPALRKAIADHYERFYDLQLDPDSGVTVTNGAAEALHSIMDAFVNPGDEVILFEPIYPYYPPNITMAGGVVRTVPLRPPNWEFDPDELEAAFNRRTRMLVLNTPHNPTGKVFSAGELEQIGALCRRWDVLAVTDEVYEHLVYEGAEHLRLADRPAMFDRTISIGSYSKTFNATGWRIGWVTGPADLNATFRLAHQYVVDCSATPLQYGAAAGLSLSDSYFSQLKQDYQRKRDQLHAAIRSAGMGAALPPAGYFILAEIDRLGFEDDFTFCRYLIRTARVAGIPPSAFFTHPYKFLGQKYLRLAFCKTADLLDEAARRLANLP